MFIEERHREILRLLEEHGSVSTAELQQEFRISYDSAKRDLRLLEERGLLRRTHGGAIPLERAIGERPARGASDAADAASLAIARRAAGLIAEGGMVFLPGTPLGRLTARSIPEERQVRVVTSSILLAAELLGRKNIELTVLGGEVDEQGEARGELACELLARFRFELGFLTPDAVSAGFGLSVKRSGELSLCSAVLRASRSVVGLCRSEGLGRDSSLSLCPIGRLDALITDWGASRETLAEIKDSAEQGEVRLICCEESEGAL